MTGFTGFQKDKEKKLTDIGFLVGFPLDYGTLFFSGLDKIDSNYQSTSDTNLVLQALPYNRKTALSGMNDYRLLMSNHTIK